LTSVNNNKQLQITIKITKAYYKIIQDTYNNRIQKIIYKDQTIVTHSPNFSNK